jgi:4-hydroxy-tetrahydrodipicolinate synthase
MINQKPKGFIPVMLTPFQENGKIDFQGLTELTRFYLEAGAAGLFANCLSSEMFELTPGERLAVIKHVLDVTDGAVPVVATGIFGGPLAQQADFVKQVYDLGVQAVIAITGLLAEENEPEAVFADRAFGLFNLTPNIPLGFYECPVPYKRIISPATLQQFVSTGRVIYHKDTCLDINQVREKLRLANNPNFGLYDAYMGHAVESLKAGSAGLSCIQGNYFPELIVWLCHNFDNPDLIGEVDRVQQFFIQHMEVMHAVYPVVSKYFLQKRGLGISTFTRRDVGNFTPKIKNDIDNFYQNYNRLQEELDLKVVV